MRPNTLLLESGGLTLDEKQLCLILPIIKLSDPAVKVAFNKRSEPLHYMDWKSQLYIIQPGHALHIVEGRILFITILCIEKPS